MQQTAALEHPKLIFIFEGGNKNRADYCIAKVSLNNISYDTVSEKK